MDWNLLVQGVGVTVLIFYAIDTRKIRLASQDQAEGLHKPCLTLRGALRDFDETVFEQGGVVGG
ncbi:MAG TPA: hypothetical protein VG028_17935 [Terriglobia bacterium]|nr:hypothetical protein [Terriglobia bacterium]